MRRAALWAAIHAIVLCLVAGCQQEQGTPPLRIYCAASFAETAAKIAAHLEIDPFTIVPGPSNGLAAQLADGAPGDVFFSAKPTWVEWLVAGDRKVAAPRTVALNQVVCAVPRGSALALDPPANLQTLVSTLEGDERVAIGAEGVPVGDYARQSFASTAADQLLRPYLVGLTDARAVLRAVESHEVRAGFIYRTDALAGDVVELFVLDPETHARADVVAVVFEGRANSKRAHALLEAFKTPWAQEVLSAAGYSTP